MENFDYGIPTRILFGENRVEDLAAQLTEHLAPAGSTILLAYGSRSIKRTGLYERIQSQLTDFDVVELSGIRANPTLDSVREGIALAKEHDVAAILAVGGGSVIDCAKIVALGSKTDADPRALLTREAPLQGALPLACVTTVAASGSDMNNGAIVVDTETGEKLTLMDDAIFPVVSVLEPSMTSTLPERQTAAASSDILTHLMEQYLVPASSFMADRLVEGVMATVIRYAPVALSQPQDAEARAQLMWASSWADNGLLCCGNQLGVFSVHGIEHGLSGAFGTTHGAGLAVIAPRWLRHVLAKDPETTTSRVAHWGRAVWGVSAELSDADAALAAIEALEHFLRSELGLPTTLEELGVDTDALDVEAYATHAVEQELLAGCWVPLDAQDVTAILRASMA